MPPTTRRHIYDRPIGVLAVLVAILVLGGLAIPGMRIRLSNSNQLGPGGVYVSLGMSGLSTRETLDRVTRPAEEIIRGLPAAGTVESYTSNGYASVQVAPAPGTTARHLVTQLEQAFTSRLQRFPVGMRAPSINTWSGDSMPLLVAAFDRGDFSDDAFTDFLDRVLIPAVQSIPGVAKAEVYRQGNRSVQVAFNAERLAALRLDSEQVAKSVNAAGQAAQSFPLPPSEGALASERHVRVLPLPLTPATLPALRLDGRISLADVATTEQRNPLRDEYRLLVNGKPGEALTVHANADANVYRASREVAQVIARECAAQGMATHLVFNSHQAFDEIAYEILIAAGWCAAFSFLFLLLFLRRWRVALLVCSALPLSLLMAGVAMAVTGSDLSLLSLIGFLLASGMVVDNAIVISESLLRARATHDAAERQLVLRRAAHAVAMAIIVSTLTTVAMFLPVMVSGDNAGRVWLIALAAPIVWSLIASLLVALVLVPMAFARLYPNGLLTAGRTSGGHGRWLIATERWYGRMLSRVLLRPALGLALTGVLLGVGMLALLVLPRPEERQFNEERTFELRARATAKLEIDQVATTMSEWSDRLLPHYKRLGIVCVLGNIWRSGGGMKVFLVPVDPLGRSSEDIKREIVRLLPPQPTVILEEHRELAQFAAMESKRKKVEAEEKAKEAKDKEAKAEQAAKENSTPTNDATVTAPKGDIKGEKVGEKVGDPSTASDETDTDEAISVSGLNFVLSAPDPRAVATAYRRLNEVLLAEGGLASEAQMQRFGTERERGDPADRTSVTLSLTRAAEEQGWRAENIASQVVRYTGGERAVRMPGGWYLGFGRGKTSDRTLSHLLETVVYQPATSPVRSGTKRTSDKSSSNQTGAAPANTGAGGGTNNRPGATTARTTASKTSTLPTTTEPLQTVNAPLLHLVQPSSEPRESQIQRENGLTKRELYVNVRTSERKRILRTFPALLARARIPDGVEVRLAEQRSDVNDGVTALWIAMGTAAAVIYLLMCILYESLLAPLTVMTTVPAGIVSVMGVFTIARIPMDPMVVLGLFLLVGIVINHGVVLVDRLGVTVPMHRLMRPDGRSSARAMLAMAAASRRRFTPVLLTSLTTIAAAVPMAFSPGRIFGAPISSLGLSLSIGLTAATVFTLVVVPIVYQWLGLTRAGTLALLRGGRAP